MLSRLIFFARVIVFSAGTIFGTIAGILLLQYLYHNAGLNLSQVGMDSALMFFSAIGASAGFGLVWVLIGFGSETKAD